MRNRCFDRRPIGEILLERGVIRGGQLRAALEAQRQEPGTYLGTMLVRQGALTENELVTALVVQCNLPYIAISRHAVDPAVLTLLPGPLARRLRVVPLDRIGPVLSVVMEDPLDDGARVEVERASGCRVAVFVSTRTEIEAALKRFYGG